MSNGTTDTTLSNPRAIETAARAATTVTIAGRHMARAAVGPLRRRAGRRRPEWRTGAAREARRAFGELGPTYVKLAQLIASSPGLFPEVLSDEFRSLLDRVPPAPPGDINHVILRELGASPGDVFAEFSPEPLASASIAQVHTAVLRDGTTKLIEGMSARLFSAATRQTNPGLIQATERQMHEMSPTAIAAALRGMAARHSVTERLEAFDLPALLICGADDAISPPDEMEQIAKRLPQASFARVSAAGHLAPLEQPDQVAATIAQWVDNVR